MSSERWDTANDRHAAYIAKAEEARRNAAKAKDATLRESFEKLAQGWEQLARQCRMR